MTGFLFSGGGSSSVTSTGSTTARTTQDRFAEVHNVRDFGAVGTGLVDDHAAIQACIDWVAGTERGVIFFPAGEYLIASPLTFNELASHSIIFRGVGRASHIYGNFAGFLLDRSITGGGNWSIDIIENLWFQNGSSNPASGAIRWNSCQGFAVRNCQITGYTGIGCYDSCFTTTIQNCSFASIGGTVVGTAGVYFFGGGGSVIQACDFMGWHDGILLRTGAAVIGCRFENCGNGIQLYEAAGSSIISCGGEANDCMIWARNYQKCFIAFCEHNGHAAAPYSGYGAGGSGPIVGDTLLWSTYGFVAGDGTRNIWLNCTAHADASTASYNGAGIKMTADAGTYHGLQPHNRWISCQANNGGVAYTGSTTKWDIGAGAMAQNTFEDCTPADPEVNRVFADMVSAPTLGMEATIKDGRRASDNAALTTAMWGTTVIGGGASKCRILYNGTNWTLMGL
jgi:hypothetical protein